MPYIGHLVILLLKMSVFEDMKNKNLKNMKDDTLATYPAPERKTKTKTHQYWHVKDSGSFIVKSEHVLCVNMTSNFYSTM